jgi:acyl-coenzyme A thioesterase 9
MFVLHLLKRRCFHSRSLKYVLTPSQRWISSSPAQLGSTINATTISTELKATTETEDIKALDNLLKVVSQYQNECFGDIANLELAALQARRPILLTTSTVHVERRQTELTMI